MLPSERQRALRLLHASRAEILLCRDVEAACHAESTTASEYYDRIRHAAFTLHANPDVGTDVTHASNETLTRSTLVGRIETERRVRMEHFEQMLQEKYDALNDRTFEAIVRCRRCGSVEVSWDDKQTRSADEGATVFCVCQTCKRRWVMR